MEEKRIVTAESLVEHNTNLLLYILKLEQHIKDNTNAITALYSEYMEKTTLCYKAINLQTDIITRQQKLIKDQSRMLRRLHREQRRSSPYPTSRLSPATTPKQTQPDEDAETPVESNTE